MRYVDLHVHSTASDGTYTPEQLVKAAPKCGLSAFALTDHDTVKGIDRAITAAKNSVVEVIPGVEISTSYKDKEIHIVGLFIDHHNTDFINGLENEIERRDARNELMIKKFNEYGIPISMPELLTMFSDSVITRAHFATFLTKKGYVEDNNEAFHRYLGEGKPLYVPRERNTPQKAIELIKSAGGVAILAHPLLYHLTMGELRILCKELTEYGLVGIETMYSTYKGFDEQNVRAIAKEFKLLESGGSDFHGNTKPHIRLGSGMGNLRINYSYLEKLRSMTNN